MKLKKCLLLLSALSLAACSHEVADPGNPDNSDPGHPIVPRDSIRNLTTQEQVVASASNQFALSLLAKADASESRPNFMLSPLSASMSLGMAMNGAASTTYDAMRNTLGFGNMTEAQTNAAYAGLIRQLYARAGTKVQFTLANSVWSDLQFKPLQTFVDTLKTYFDAEVQAIDFRNASAPKTISQWASDKTKGKITDLVESISPDEVMFLINAVYFKALWSKPFDPRSTSPRPFTRSDGSRVNVPMMSREGIYRTVQKNGVIAVELPYADSAYTIVLWMPSSSAERWTIPVGLTNANVLLTLPKFRVEYDLVLNSILTQMGMGIAFTAGADLSRIAGTNNLAISKVYQRHLLM